MSLLGLSALAGCAATANGIVCIADISGPASRPSSGTDAPEGDRWLGASPRAPCSSSRHAAWEPRRIRQGSSCTPSQLAPCPSLCSCLPVPYGTGASARAPPTLGSGAQEIHQCKQQSRAAAMTRSCRRCASPLSAPQRRVEGSIMPPASPCSPLLADPAWSPLPAAAPHCRSLSKDANAHELWTR